MDTLKIKINNLMMLNDIANESELARCLSLPLSALNRFLSGKKQKNNQAILDSVANFFSISVDHLLSDDKAESIYILESERHPKSPSEALRYLINDIGAMSEGELSRRTGVPQPTIHRILSGATPNPRLEAIAPLAEFFNVSTDQMLGRVPLPKDRIPGSFVTTVLSKKIVPLLDWDESASWPEIINHPDFKTERKWISSESGIKGSGFALKISSTDYLPEFRKNTVIVIDCSRTPKNGDFIIGILKKNQKAILGRFSISKDGQTFLSDLTNGSEFYFRKTIQLSGVVSETRHIL